MGQVCERIFMSHLPEHGRNSMPTAALILAAGASTRMGRPKQILPYGSGTLVSNAVMQAKLARFERVLVVVGARAELVERSVADLGAEIVLNEEWETGMGSSIFAGLQQLETSGPRVAALAILLADQPRITADHLLQMRCLFEAGSAPVVAAKYDGSYGAPAIFRDELFPDLASLPSSLGARHLLRGSRFAVTGFELPEARIDIDTPADFAALELVRP
jgi:molybdenum cofactor cytidylyltransferase